MKIQFLGTGPEKIVEGKGRNRRTNTSALLSYNNKNILINISKDFEEHVRKYNLQNIDAILITHGHRDAVGGGIQFNKWQKTRTLIPVYCERETCKLLKGKFERNKILPGQSFNLFGIKVTPFRVKHSREPEKYPTIGFKIGNITWIEDTAEIPEKAEKYFNNKIVILDAAMWFGTQIYNHFNTKQALDFMRDKNTEHLFLIQIGRNYPSYDKALKQIQEYWKKIKGKAKVHLTYDGMKVNISNLQIKENEYSNQMRITKNIDVTKLTDKQIIYLHNILHVWYEKGKEDWSKEDIWNLHKLLVQEMEKRKLKHIPKNDLDKKIKSELDEFTEYLKDAIICKDAVSIIGSFLEKKDYHDIDILIRPTHIDFINRAIMARIDKMLPKEFSDKTHYVHEPEGPHDSFVPLYDLALIRRNSELIQMTDEIKTSEELAIPQKPKSDAFYDPREMVKEMFKKEGKWFVEKKWDGFHVIVSKKGDMIKIITEDGKNITKNLPTLISEVNKLSSKSFEIDGELIYHKNGDLGTRRDLMQFIKPKEKRDDSKTGLVVWDITYLDKSVIALPLFERKKLLGTLHFSKRIKQTQYKIVNNSSQALSVINKFSKLKRSEGAVVKKIDAKYQKGKQSSDWLKYRKMADIHVRVLKVIPAASGINRYLVGIDLPKALEGKIIPKYIIDGKLRLGRTFLTKKKAGIGNIVDIKIEEIYRHKDEEGKIRYSIHKPRFQNIRPDLKSTSTLRDLDAIVVSLGIEVPEGQKLELRTIDGLILVKPHGEMIWKGEKKLIIKSKKFDIVGKPFYIIQNNKVYGTIQIRSCEPIDLKQFKEYEDLHKITNEERKKWWSGKKQLYAYQFDLITRYAPPIKTEIPKGAQVFVKGIELNKSIEELPFAGYKNFADCVRKVMLKKGWPKERASAYCAAIRKKVEGLQEEPEKWKKYQILGPEDKPIRDFPKILQTDFRIIMKHKLKPRFVIHHHERGKSNHTDIRFEIPLKRYLQGFTIASPASITDKDKITNQARNVLIVEVKPHQPKIWLRMEGRSEKGEPGSTKHKAGIFTIVGKGTYEVWHVDDHKIGIIFHSSKGKVKTVKGRLMKEPSNLKQLTGKFSFTINHIREDRWVGYFNHIKSAKLSLKNNTYILQLSEDYQRVSIKPLKNFSGIDAEYGYEEDNIKIANLHFDSSIWNKEKIFSFLKKHGKQILDYRIMREENLFECQYVQALLDELVNLSKTGIEKLTFESAITEILAEFKMPYEINFTALKPGIFNGVFYSEEELKKGCKSLEGKDLTIDHGKSVRDVIGKVISVNWNNIQKQMEGKALIFDESIAKRIKDKLITGVSVEVMVNYFRGEHGLTAKDAEFIALSLVRNPACKTCLIQPS